MKDYFGDFLAPFSAPASSRLGQTTSSSPPFSSHIIWMVLSGVTSAYLSWKICSWYHHYKHLVKSAKKNS